MDTLRFEHLMRIAVIIPPEKSQTKRIFDMRAKLPTKHIRATRGSRVVVVLSDFLHKSGRECKCCRARWTILIDTRRRLHVWRNGVPMGKAILDRTGNNAAVECCQKRVLS